MTAHQPAHGDYHEHAHGTHEHAHVSNPLSLLATFGALLVLTVITVWISRGPIDFGWLSLFIALIVATIKAMLVMLFFMHLIHDRRFNMVAFFSGYLFLALFLFFALLDSGQYQQDIKSFQVGNPPTPTTSSSAGS
jgi:cytochrome c oxidase subunit 4